MHTVERLEEMLELAQRLGYQVRHEWLDGGGGGACEFAGKKWLFVDLALGALEQFEQVREALRNEPALAEMEMTLPLRKLLGLRKAA